ncbi:hypothetical protein [Actinocorallia sp. A-T 12471]|uniref:hypothetical protein n=1 Tax=Actinocorallia sp. A-T 12471 TaxID=3089813 RepID=UPI0029CD4DC3|nr:hypothetical protein [Actinocorallia sp. A-T 12471]MDX6741152.1 hypothetical protein [Actinocorallia sp. A-T 12471]
MNSGPSVHDVRSYLGATGWECQAEERRDTAVWAYGEDSHVLVPDGDGYADWPRRAREILRMLAEIEGRAVAEVAADVAEPMADVQWYRAPGAMEGGLLETAAALGGLRQVLDAAARAVIAPGGDVRGPEARPVRDLLARVRIDPVRGELLTVRVPSDVSGSLGRRALLLLHGVLLPALSDAVAGAGRSESLEGMEGLVANGLSAELCDGLARFGGADRGEGFEVGVRWARGLPAGRPGQAVAFGRGSGRLLRIAANRLRRTLSRDVVVSGTIGSLFDNGATDRFRVQVHGVVVAEDGSGTRGGLWVRLPDQAAYDQALSAHQSRRPVRAQGPVRFVHGRHELTTAGLTTPADDLPEEG